MILNGLIEVFIFTYQILPFVLFVGLVILYRRVIALGEDLAMLRTLSGVEGIVEKHYQEYLASGEPQNAETFISDTTRELSVVNRVRSNHTHKPPHPSLSEPQARR